MIRRFILITLAVGLLGTGAHAQLYVGAGSTFQGDYLRGVGVEAYGLGVYNELTAVANQINAQTFMTLNEYFSAVAEYEGHVHALRRKEELAKISEARRKIQERIHDNPETRDVMSGDALNSILRDLTSPQVSDSTSRYVRVPLDAGVIRRIPFKLGEKEATFSMGRFSLKGKNKWAVALSFDKYKLYRDAYQRAVDRAIDLAIDGNPTEGAIIAVERAVDDLEDRMKADPEMADPRNQRLYSEAKTQIDILRKTEKLFMTLKIQQVLGEIDNYSGTTVDELRLFVRRHGLSFANAETPDERDLFVKLHTALKEHNQKITLP
jgi:hypothetical protein